MSKMIYIKKNISHRSIYLCDLDFSCINLGTLITSDKFETDR